MSTPKAPKKSPEQEQLEQAQLEEIQKRKQEEQASIAQRREALKNRSLGRQPLIKTGERGVL